MTAQLSSRSPATRKQQPSADHVSGRSSMAFFAKSNIWSAAGLHGSRKANAWLRSTKGRIRASYRSKAHA